MINSDISMDVILEAMSISYDSIFMVNIERNNIVAFRKSDKLPKEFWDFVSENPSYDELLKYYVERYVSDDSDQMLDMVCLDALSKQLKDQPAYSYDHRINRNGETLWYRMRIVNFSDGPELSLFIIGFENITNEKNREEILYGTGKKLLIISEKIDYSKVLENSFNSDFDMICADGINEGWLNLVEKAGEIAAIILDYTILKEACFNFLKKYSRVQRYKSIPVVVVLSVVTPELEVKLLSEGASDIIVSPINVELAKTKIRSLIRLRTASSLHNIPKVDPLTGLYSKDYFYEQVEEIIQSDNESKFILVVSDIEKFKVINERYGIDVGDEVLKYFADSFKKAIPNYVIGGRIGGDVFAVLQRDLCFTFDENIKIARKLIANAPVANLVINQGVYSIDREENLTAQAMCDRASLAMNSIKGVYGKYFAVYDDKFRQDLLIQQQIVDNMEHALRNKEFQVYLQPKYDVKNNRVAGAEALVRWIHPELGFMNPGMFIPIFEKNGFIKNLDGYVFEQVCHTLDRWKKEDKCLVPISINLSRRDFEVEDLADNIIGFVDAFGIDHSLIHFEVTETAFIENAGVITDIIEKFHDAGFVIELDDFGTGYSSLTTLNSIDIDVLKLDMSIIKNYVPGSERNVLEFCMQLVNMMGLDAVAEGVETKEQVEKLAQIGCDYIQGYYFSKPIPIVDFEKYLLEKNSNN
ncbi:MAG: bifunctional diguanylate cyclase/phosphodiesterase [Lachnospiraceae bacterium]|nr:bifunctional diguanylate cyclase/phosphodiesterase [Lachnospiraceae bacterium]